MMRQSLLLLLFIPLGMFSQRYQLPYLKDWISNAIEIRPGLYMSASEVSVRDYVSYEYLVLRDSGETMFAERLPAPEFHYLGIAWRRDDGDYGHEDDIYGLRVFPIEADHPMTGISQRQAMQYCAWRSQYCNELIRDFGNAEEEAVRKLLPVTFRLPTPEEWKLAASQVQLHDDGQYEELPSRYLFTRTVASAHKGETLLHLGNNVSEMTIDPAVVMGGNYEAAHLQQSGLSGHKPDLRMGFRLVLELSDAQLRLLRQQPTWDKRSKFHSEEAKWNSHCYNQFAKVNGDTPYYPFVLEENCTEIEPGIWVLNHQVTVGEYVYHIAGCLQDSGDAYIEDQYPAGTLASGSDERSTETLEQAFPGDQSLPVANVSVEQAGRFCDWMTIKNRFAVCYPGTVFLYWFRLPTDEEWQKARAKLGLGEGDAVSEKGFRYVVEVMPMHPDSKKSKYIPAMLAD